MWHLSSHNYSLGRLWRFRDPKLEDRFQADMNKWSAYNTQHRLGPKTDGTMATVMH